MNEDMLNKLVTDLKVMKQFLDDRIGEEGCLTSDIEEIKEHTKLTNGNVAQNRKMINMAIGGLAVITVIVIPLLAYVWSI